MLEVISGAVFFVHTWLCPLYSRLIISSKFAHCSRSKQAYVYINVSNSFLSTITLAIVSKRAHFHNKKPVQSRVKHLVAMANNYDDSAELMPGIEIFAGSQDNSIKDETRLDGEQVIVNAKWVRVPTFYITK